MTDKRLVPKNSHIAKALSSSLLPAQSVVLPPVDKVLAQSERAAAGERFFHRNFAQCSLPTNLYDQSGARQIEPLVPDSAPDFPLILMMPRVAGGGCAFVVAGERLYFLYDRIERWADAPDHLAFVAVQIDASLISVHAEDGSPGVRLSNSEYLLLAHLLSGNSLKAAAATLGASYDTKRKQVQVVLDKFAAQNQTALLRDLALEMTARLLDELLPKDQRRRETALVKRQFGRDVVTNNITVGGGVEVPVWEFGARNGRPVLHFHNMMSPVIFRDDMAELLRQNGLRWLVVPRHFLDAGAPFNADRRMGYLSRALADTMDYLTETPLICIGDSSGVSWAAHFTRHNSQMVGHLLLASTPQPMQTMPPDERSTIPDERSTIFVEVSNRLRRDARVTAGLARAYNTLAQVPLLARRGLRHLYRHSPPRSEHG